MTGCSSAFPDVGPESPLLTHIHALPAPLQDDTLAPDARHAPLKHADLVASYSTKMVASSLGSAALLTVIGTVTWAFVPSQSWGGHPILVWALLALQIPGILWSRSHLLAGRQRDFMKAYWVTSVVQFVWIQLLCWVSGPTSWAVGVAMMLAWAYNDAWNFYDSPHVRAQYLVALPAFDAALLLLDAFGGRGLLHLAERAPGTALAFVVSQAIFVAMAQVIVVMVGRHARQHDSRFDEHLRLEHELTLLRREREIIQQSCTFLTKGLTASRFSHDVANPLCVVTGNAGLLRDMLSTGPLGAEGPSRALMRLAPAERRAVEDAVSRWSGELGEITQEIEQAVERVMKMTSVLARSVRSRDPLAEQSVEALVQNAIERAAANAQAHGVQSLSPFVRLEPHQVHVTGDHSESIANILTNGALQRPDVPLEITGRRSGPWFYSLQIRDFGVSPAERPAALEAIRRSLALSPREASSTPEGDRTYRGYGIGLMLAKVLLLRYNGWLSVDSPEAGPGVVFRIVLPTEEPAMIPERENLPERV